MSFIARSRVVGLCVALLVGSAAGASGSILRVPPLSSHSVVHNYVPGKYGRFIDKEFVTDSRDSSWVPKGCPFIRMDHVIQSYHSSSLPVWQAIVKAFGEELGRNHNVVRFVDIADKLFSKNPFFQNMTPQTTYYYEEHDESSGPFGSHAIKHSFFFDVSVAPRKGYYYPIKNDLMKLFANFKTLLFKDPAATTTDVLFDSGGVGNGTTISVGEISHPFLQGYFSAVGNTVNGGLSKEIFGTGDSSGNMKDGLLSTDTSIKKTFKDGADEYDPLFAFLFKP